MLLTSFQFARFHLFFHGLPSENTQGLKQAVTINGKVIGWEDNMNIAKVFNERNALYKHFKLEHC